MGDRGVSTGRVLPRQRRHERARLERLFIAQTLLDVEPGLMIVEAELRALCELFAVMEIGVPEQVGVRAQERRPARCVSERHGLFERGYPRRVVAIRLRRLGRQRPGLPPRLSRSPCRVGQLPRLRQDGLGGMLAAAELREQGPDAALGIGALDEQLRGLAGAALAPPDARGEAVVLLIRLGRVLAITLQRGLGIRSTLFLQITLDDESPPFGKLL